MKIIPIKPIIVFTVILGAITIVYILQSVLFDKNETANNVSTTKVEIIPRDLNEDPYVLDITAQELNTVPEFVFDRPTITHLIMSNNNLTALPDKIGKLTKIRVLDINNNQLSGTLTSQILKMSLVDINVSKNNLNSLPSGIGNLQSLRYADFSHNKITSIPNEITKLQDLKWLNLTGNPLNKSQIDFLQDKMLFTIINF